MLHLRTERVLAGLAGDVCQRVGCLWGTGRTNQVSVYDGPFQRTTFSAHHFPMLDLFEPQVLRGQVSVSEICEPPSPPFPPPKNNKNKRKEQLEHRSHGSWGLRVGAKLRPPPAPRTCNALSHRIRGHEPLQFKNIRIFDRKAGSAPEKRIGEGRMG